MNSQNEAKQAIDQPQLVEILRKISSRIEKISLLFPLHKANARKIAEKSKSVSDFYDAMLIQKADRETYVLEYYLLFLAKFHPANKEEQRKIHTTTSAITQTLPILYEVIKESYDQKINISALEEKQKTKCNWMLVDATKEGDDELLDASLAAGADVNFQSHCGYALLNAVEKRNYLLALKLIKAGANVNIKQRVSYDLTPRKALLIAIENDDLLMVQLLVTSGANDITRALFKACERTVSSELFQLLLSCPNINLDAELPGLYKRYKTMLPTALDSKNGLEKAKCLLKAGIKKTEDDFCMAIYISTEAVKLLLDHDYPYTNEALICAIERDNAEIVDLIINNKKERNAKIIEGTKLYFKKYKSYTDLMFYTAIGDINQVTHLLTSIADEKSNSQLNEKNSALLIATKLKRLDLMRLLLNAGANTTCRDDHEYTPLMIAAGAGNDQTVKLLLEYKANINEQTTAFPKGETALLMATKRGHLNVVKTLLSIDQADINILSDMRESANILGFRSNNTEISDAYKLKNETLHIASLENELKKQISCFRNNAKSFFSINNNKKADKIQDALNRAKAHESANSNISTFLNYKEQGKESIIDALSYHRIGFFGEPNSSKEIVAFLNQMAEIHIFNALGN